jgi:hypothetical protein
MAENKDLALRPHRRAAFSYKTINPTIRRILDNRSALDNTVQVAMPFIKVTSTLQNPDILGYGNYGFTLGMHATELDAQFDDIYTNKNGKAYLGYTYTTEGRSQRVYVPDDSSEVIRANKLFDTSGDLFSNTTDSFIPPPGITRATISRYKSGLLAQAQINFSVPTLQQLEILHRIFLVPGAGMVVEWGQQFAITNDTPDFGEGGLLGPVDFSSYMFPWYDKNKLTEMFKRLGKKEIGLDFILRNYAYPSQGQYMWMFGRVGNFSTQGNSDGSYECTLKIIGSSEDAWAYTTRNTVIPGNDGSRTNPKICIDSTNSVESYFTVTTEGLNFKTLVEGVHSGAKLPEWKSHVYKMEKGNKKAGEEPTDGKVNTDQTTFADSEDAYFITWRFFVNVVLNDKVHGLKAVYAKANLTPSELAKITLLRSYKPATGTVQQFSRIIDPYENFVGNNPFLRSTDPSVLIIANEQAPLRLLPLYREQGIQNPERLLGSNDSADAKALSGNGKFQFVNSAFQLPDEESHKLDKGFLSTGVWLNHQAVCTALLSGDTIMRGIANLLQKMNAATMGYWQLAIDTIEPIPGEPPLESTYTVVDLNYHESVDNAIDNFLNDVHIFNKYIRSSGDTLVGSELIESSIELNLPKRMFSQIATLGLATKEEVSAVGGDSEEGEGSPTISDPNDTLRKMFAITSISEEIDGSYADLTYEASREVRPIGQCGKQYSGIPASAGGVKPAVAPGKPQPVRTTEQLEKETKELKEKIASEECQEVFKKNPESSAAPTTSGEFSGSLADSSCIDATGPTGKQAYRPPPGYENYQNGRIPLSALKGVERSPNAKSYYTFNGEPNWFLLHPEAADKYLQLRAAAQAAGIRFTLSSAYRNADHQSELSGSGRAAAPGSSPHGWGGAIDISELYRAVNGSTGAGINKSVRQTNPLYRWMRENAPKFGWYNPCRLADGISKDEVWHWEYWGSRGTPPTTVTPTPVVPSTPPPSIATPTPQLDRVAQQCIESRQKLKQLTPVLEQEKKVQTFTNRFEHLQGALRYIEGFPDFMVAQIRNTSNDKDSNAFGAAPGTLSITANMTLPGINGIRIGELFWVDRMPAFYRAFGAFQVMSLEDNISVDGWTTKIQGRFNYLGATWREQMTKKLMGNP